MVGARGTADQYWNRDGLGARILAALTEAGKNVDALTVDDLAATDQFHGGGKDATLRLARLASLEPGTRVLDVGGGLGGPARTLAAQFGCRVTTIDLTPSYVEAARMLTARVGLAGKVAHDLGDALALPYADGAFDLVWTQNTGMNIEDKARLYAGFHRVLRRGGRLATQEPMAGRVEPVLYPVMWARDPSGGFLRTPSEMRALIEGAGFRIRVWDDVTAETAGPVDPATIPAHSAQRLIMGSELDAIIRVGHQNRDEGRIVSVQAIAERG